MTGGHSYGTVATITDGNTLTLTAEGWSGGTPANGTAFSIEAADPKTGAPEFADVLEDDDRHRGRQRRPLDRDRSRPTSSSRCRWRWT